jgi:hypothetical protein
MGRSLSFIVEGLNGKNRNDSIFYRTQAQYKCLVSLVEGCQLKKDSIKKLVQLNRDNAVFNPMSSVSIQMDHFLPKANENEQSLKMSYWSIKYNQSRDNSPPSPTTE